MKTYLIEAKVEKGLKSFMGIFSNFGVVTSLSQSELTTASENVLKNFLKDHNFKNGKILDKYMKDGKLHVKLEVE